MESYKKTQAFSKCGRLYSNGYAFKGAVLLDQAMEEEVNKLAGDYNSFIYNEKNLNSEVQFVMQTEEIKIQKSVIVSGLQGSDGSKTFFQKIVSWFRN